MIDVDVLSVIIGHNLTLQKRDLTVFVIQHDSYDLLFVYTDYIFSLFILF